MMRENIKTLAKESIGYYEAKKHTSWFEEGCSNYWMKGNEVNCSG
jgi:hypothetical protein